MELSTGFFLFVCFLFVCFLFFLIKSKCAYAERLFQFGPENSLHAPYILAIYLMMGKSASLKMLELTVTKSELS